jgi:hypothetical protein
MLSSVAVLILLTLLTCLKGDQSDRVILTIVDVMAHFVYLQYLGSILPPNGDRSPLIGELIDVRLL